MRITYFVHDLTDPAVGKRVRMLKTAGADIVVVGFRRGEKPVVELEGAAAVDLGRTYDAQFVHRALKVVRRRLSLGEARRAAQGADVLLARNLEMLAIASAAQRTCAPKATLVYECLDVHRLLLSNSAAGRFLRFVERSLMRRARLLIVSSPAFLSRYFELRQGVGSRWDQPVLVVENKVLDLAAASATEHARADELASGPPWRIGWFGMIRCQRSLDILCRLASRNPGLVEIVIRGRPARAAFADFDAQVARTPGVVFGGPYGAAELGALYSAVHFNWAIDYFEDGANSALLLPNRIYEGGRYGVVPIALGRTETGHWLKRRGIGVLLDSPADELAGFLERLTPAAYGGLRLALRTEPRRSFVADREDCERLLQALAGAGNGQAARTEREARHSVNRV